MTIVPACKLLIRFTLPDYIEPVFHLGSRAGIRPGGESVSEPKCIDQVPYFMHRSQTGVVAGS